MTQHAKNRDTVQDEHDYVLQIYPRPDFVFERGEGPYLIAADGQRYLDFVAGIAVNALGYGDAEIAATIADQSQQLIHVSNLYHTAPAAGLARMMIEASPGLDRVFFCNSGAEAIEAAIKFARRHARDRVGEGKTTLVAFDGSFHGRTMGAVAVTAREKYRTPFMPVMPDVRFATFNDIASLEATITADVCAVIVEPVQGEGGLRVAAPAFLQRLRELCDQHRALLITDEIQCGMGRTGMLWAHQLYAIEPDIMTVAKPLANGLPVGAVLLKQAVADSIHPGDHGTTFGGGPLVTAVGQVVFRRVSDPAFLSHVRDVADYFDEALQDFAAEQGDRVIELRGSGLMRGLQIRGSAAAVRSAGHDVGVLVATAGDDVLRLLPPLIIEPSHVDEALAKLRSAFKVL